MAEDSQSGEPPPQGSVFGNLPDSRPGTRSPRRRGGKDAPASSKASPAKSSAAAKPAKQAPLAPASPGSAPKGRPAGTPQTPAPGARTEGIGSIEDLAWAGVAAAAEAATLGVRLAGRALDALRGSPERD